MIVVSYFSFRIWAIYLPVLHMDRKNKTKTKNNS